MQKIFRDTRILDKAARESFSLTEDIMMENAAAALEAKVLPHMKNPCGHYLARPSVLVLAGKGNNGADGYALARRLISHEFAVTVCQVQSPESPAAKIQYDRALKTGVQFISPYELDDYIEEKSFDLLAAVDCIFGSGTRLPLPAEAQAVIESINAEKDVFKLACDIPSGIDMNGCTGNSVFEADETVTMGALKEALFSDEAKDCCGIISVANLGISRTNFEAGATNMFLLEKEELNLPFRKKQNVHKGTFGHALIFSGEKPGASFIAGKAAFGFGCGLVTLKGSNVSSPYAELMTSDTIPEKVSAMLFGPGFGRDREDSSEILSSISEMKAPAVFDADAFYYPEMEEILSSRSSLFIPTVVTPHPKEFSSLLEICGLGSFTVEETCRRRVELAQIFCKKFPSVVLVLKGANTLIAFNDFTSTRIYFNTLGSNSLAKGGSGDVLAGLAVSLLTQKYSAMQAAVTASLVHALASRTIKPEFSLTPEKLIEKITALEGME